MMIMRRLKQFAAVALLALLGVSASSLLSQPIAPLQIVQTASASLLMVAPGPLHQVATPPDSGDAPAWAATVIANGLDYGEWAKIGGPGCTNGLSDTNVPRDVKTVNPSDAEFDGIVNNWSGGAWAPDYGNFGGLIVGPGGGHTGYPGNDSFIWDSDTRTWRQLWPDTSTTSLNVTFGEYADGSPSGFHTYQQILATPALSGHSQGLLVLIKSVSTTEGETVASSTPYPHYLDLANPAAGWTRLDAIPDNATRNSWKEAEATVWDTTRNKVWLWAISNPHANTVFASLDPLASPGSQWAQTRPANANDGHGWNANGTEQVIFRDTVNDVIVTLDWNDNDNMRYLFPASPGTYNTNGTTGFPITEAGSWPAKTEGGAVGWSTRDSAAYFWGGATHADVYRLKQTSGSLGSQGVAGSVTYTSTDVLAGSNSITPATQGHNDDKVYGRGEVVEYLVNGVTEVFMIAFTEIDGPVYVFRIPPP